MALKSSVPGYGSESFDGVGVAKAFVKIEGIPRCCNRFWGCQLPGGAWGFSGITVDLQMTDTAPLGK